MPIPCAAIPVVLRVLAVALAILSCNVARAEPRIIILGDVPGASNPRPSTISADGSAVIGSCVVPGVGERPFRWTASGGARVLISPIESGSSEAIDLSADGSYVTGYINVGVFGYTSVRWEPHGTVNFIELAISSAPVAISADGSVIAGYAEHPDGNRIFMWRAGEGMSFIGHPSQKVGAAITAMSANGAVLAGYMNSGPGSDNRAFLWTAAGSYADLGIPEGGIDSEAFAISYDGSVVTGRTYGLTYNEQVFRWTPSGGMEGLRGGNPSVPYSVAGGVMSGDGAAVLGRTNIAGMGPTPLPAVWTRAAGWVWVDPYLRSLGVDLTGWQTLDIKDFGATGSVVLGSGIFQNQPRNFVITQTTPTEPCHADFNDDGSVTTPDLVFLLGRFGQSSHDNPLAARADFNGDGQVNTPDLTYFLNRFGTTCP